MIRISGLVLLCLAFSFTVESTAQMGGKGKKGGDGGGAKKGSTSGKGQKGGGGGGLITKGEAGTVSGTIAAISPNHIVIQMIGGADKDAKGKGGDGRGKGDAKGGKGGDAKGGMGDAKGGMGDAKGGKGGDAKGGKGGDAKGGKGGAGGAGGAGKGKAGGPIVFFLSPTTAVVDQAGNAAMGKSLKIGTSVQIQYQAFRASSGQSAQVALEIKLLAAE